MEHFDKIRHNFQIFILIIQMKEWTQRTKSKLSKIINWFCLKILLPNSFFTPSVLFLLGLNLRIRKPASDFTQIKSSSISFTFHPWKAFTPMSDYFNQGIPLDYLHAGFYLTTHFIANVIKLWLVPDSSVGSKLTKE